MNASLPELKQPAANPCLFTSLYWPCLHLRHFYKCTLRNTFLTADSNMLQKMGNCLKLPVLRVRSSMSVKRRSNEIASVGLYVPVIYEKCDATYMLDQIFPSTDLLSLNLRFQRSVNPFPPRSSQQTQLHEIRYPPSPQSPPPSLWVCMGERKNLTGFNSFIDKNTAG